jgi:predicted membrane protein
VLNPVTFDIELPGGLYMGFLDIFSLFVLLVILALGVAILLLLAWLPGNIAKKGHSPWAEAINVAGWVGILLPPIWMLALIAAFIRPRVGEGAAIAISEAETTELAATITGISQRIATMEKGMRELALRTMSRGAEGSQP